MQTDVLVVGSGIAGLFYAIKTAEALPQKKITVITKANDEAETNTNYAQGGVAGVTNTETDSYEKHVKDTLIAGDGLCDVSVVEMVVRDGVSCIQDLISWGAQFDKNSSGDYSLGKEGGHSENRILHYKDITGYEIERTLVEKAKTYKNIEVVTHCYVLDIITQHHLGYLITKGAANIECYGVYALNKNNNKIEKILAPVTMLATGGCGQVYRSTTNPAIATGDGIAMVYRAKGRVENMEFIQFHPTALYEPNVKGQSFLITEAVRGDGAVLRNKKNEAFMEKYDSRKDLAPRDIVARAIDNEMKIEGTEYVYLDCTHMDIKKFKEHFPNIYEKCKSIGIDVAKDYIPVCPAAHYSCGGIHTNKSAESNIKYLLAAGECACTGLHGANRLASNSLLEAMVFANNAHYKTIDLLKNYPTEAANNASKIPDWNAEGTTQPKELILITQSLKELKSIMSDYVGIVRNNERLQRAEVRLEVLHKETESLYQKTTVSPHLCELRNMITVSYLIEKSAAFRKESRGLHFTTDFPYKSELIQNTVL